MVLVLGAGGGLSLPADEDYENMRIFVDFQKNVSTGVHVGTVGHGKGYTVYGLMKGQNNPKTSLIQEEHPYVELVQGDLADLTSLITAVEQVQPAEVYNLGAISFVAYSWENAFVTSDVTAMGVLNVLEAVRLHAGDDPSAIRFYQASSSEMFGKVQEVPQSENTLLWPRSPYGVSKVYGHYMTINYRESYGMHASSGILFNHESPRRGPEFVTRKISQAVARIHLGQQDSMALGNLDARRDWGYAGDYVEAMWRMLQAEEPEDFVIATGETHSVREAVEVAFARQGLDPDEHLEIDPRYYRPSEVDVLLGDASKARDRLGWEPTVRFKELVELMVDADVAQLSDQLAGKVTRYSHEGV